MSLDEKALRETFQSSLTAARRDSDDDTPCPPSEKIWDAVNLVLEPRQRRDIVSHTTLCARCALVWQAAVSVSREAAGAEGALTAQPPTAASQDSKPSWWQQILRPAWLGPALAGAAALLVAVVWVDRPAPLGALPPAEPSGVLRGAGDAPVIPATHADALGAGATLRWSEAADAEGYELVLLGTAGQQVRKVTARPFFVLDSASLEPFAVGETISWSVTIVGGSASGEMSSERSFTLTD